jgi:hypothetical protein
MAVFVTTGVGASLANAANSDIDLVLPGRLLREPQILTAGTAISHPAGTRAIRIRGVAGGGAGGGCDAAAGSVGAAGSAGTYGERWIVLASLSSTYVVGAGGAGVSGAAGADGTLSSFTHNAVTTSLSPGNGGAFLAGGATVARAIGGGSPNSGTNCDLTIRGQKGGDALRVVAATVPLICGPGGSSPLGDGAGMRCTVGNADSGPDAHGFGAGGGGRVNGTSASAGAGGNGSPGVWIVEEYC